MDSATLVVLLLGALLAMAMMIIAGLVLHERQYTQLGELVHALAMLVAIRSSDLREAVGEQRRDLLAQLAAPVVQQRAEKLPEEPPQTGP